ncbi:MAG: small multi-drug export protein [Methanospirillaceae archaeon]|nr:small multi-drug export protein [Methanospirillaceae archaeon]
MKQEEYCVIHPVRIYFSPRIDRCIKIGLPILLITLYMLYWFLVLPYELFLVQGGLLLAYFIPPAGKETIIPIGIELGIPWWTIATSVAFIDAITALFVVWNFDLIQKVPGIGTIIKKIVSQGYDYLQKHRWVDRLYVIGLVLFVMIPLQGTGGIGGAIIGNILGMKKGEIVGSVTCGAFLGSFLIGISMNSLHDQAGEMFWLVILFLAIIILVTIVFSLVYRIICNRRES